MDGTLGTTNTLLAILAAVAGLGALALIVAAVMVLRLLRDVRDRLQDLQQQLPRLAERVDNLAASVQHVVANMQDVTSRTSANADRMYTAVNTASDVASMAVSSAHLVFGRRVSVLLGIARSIGMVYRILKRRRTGEPSALVGRQNRATDHSDDDTRGEDTLREATHGV
jgi:cell division septum initiation protein DivIVA